MERSWWDIIGFVPTWEVIVGLGVTKAREEGKIEQACQEISNNEIFRRLKPLFYWC